VTRGGPPDVVTTSDLPASPEAVWERVASLDGINDELGPWLRMTSPPGAVLVPEHVPIGRTWFRSWILLFGLFPFDYDDLCVERLDPGRGFLERSTMLSARVWEHERTLEPLDGGGTRVTDRVRFEPRVPGTARLHRTVVAAIFRHRHRRLRRCFADS
jgi:ligand-binding SRPBCC domain-containing protein